MYQSDRDLQLWARKKIFCHANSYTRFRNTYILSKLLSTNVGLRIYTSLPFSIHQHGLKFLIQNIGAFFILPQNFTNPPKLIFPTIFVVVFVMLLYLDLMFLIKIWWICKMIGIMELMNFASCLVVLYCVRLFPVVLFHIMLCAVTWYLYRFFIQKVNFVIVRIICDLLINRVIFVFGDTFNTYQFTHDKINNTRRSVTQHN